MTSQNMAFTNIIKVTNTKSQPQDTVSVIVHDPSRVHEQGFVTGGWDGILRYYFIRPKTIQQIELGYQKQLNHPILAACFANNSVIIAGLANGDIIAVDPSSDNAMKIGGHLAPICKLFYIASQNIVISLGYDLALMFWTLDGNNGNFFAAEFKLPSKTHSAAYDFPYLMIITAEGKGYFIDLSHLPNITVPDYNKVFDMMQTGSKVQAMKINADKKLYAVGCVDGRVALGEFQASYDGIKLHSDSSKKMLSKSMKKQSSYSSINPFYGQVNEIDIGISNDIHFLVVVGTEESAFFNLVKKDKVKRIKDKCTAGHISLDGKYFMYAIGNDWCEGIYDLKLSKKPQIMAIRFTNSQMQSFIKK